MLLLPLRFTCIKYKPWAAACTQLPIAEVVAMEWFASIYQMLMHLKKIFISCAALKMSVFTAAAVGETRTVFVPIITDNVEPIWFEVMLNLCEAFSSMLCFSFSCGMTNLSCIGFYQSCRSSNNFGSRLDSFMCVRSITTSWLGSRHFPYSKFKWRC